MQVTNPATEETCEIPETDISTIPDLVNKATQAQTVWGTMELEVRANRVKQLATLIESHQQELAQTISSDMGKPIKNALKEAGHNPKLISFLCDKALEWLAPEAHNGGTIFHDPLGVVAVVSPWNFPLAVSTFGIVPALLAGNSVISKPSEHALRTGILLGQLINEIDGLPKDVFQVVVGGKEHGEALVKADVQMVAFTGSTATGKKIMQNCADGIKRIHLELGGLDAAIVLDDADIALAAKRLVQSNCSNTGQICCAAKRVFVHEDNYDEFVNAAVEVSQKTTFGDPATEIHMGPLVAKFQQDKVASIVDDAKAKGATVKTGGSKPDMKGYFYPSTILTNVTNEMRVLNEEPFGPVLPIIKYTDLDEAIAQANGTEYGLTASVWSTSEDRASAVAKKLVAGQVGINGHASAPLGSPFGGAKQSGIGRTQSKEGMQSFTNTKFVYTSGT